jgi:multicomponent K+:H+ antiporter subunit E
MIGRWLPYPVLSLLLLLIWLLFNQSVAPGTIVAGLVFAVVLAQVFGLLRPPKSHLRNYPLLGRLFVRVVFDIVRSNLAVARLILRRDHRTHSGFVAIPLTLVDPYGLAVLACIITSTPGTIWVSHDSGASILLIHVLDLVDEQTWIDSIKRRYEQLLLEIFQ